MLCKIKIKDYKNKQIKTDEHKFFYQINWLIDKKFTSLSVEIALHNVKKGVSPRYFGVEVIDVKFNPENYVKIFLVLKGIKKKSFIFRISETKSYVENKKMYYWFKKLIYREIQRILAHNGISMLWCKIWRTNFYDSSLFAI